MIDVARTAAGLVFATLFVTTAAGAHGFAPGLLEVRELSVRRYTVLWKAPPSRSSTFTPRFPDHCRREANAAPEPSAGSASFFVLDCGARGLEGHTVEVAGLDDAASTDWVWSYSAGGRVQTGVLRAGDARFVVPAAAAAPSFPSTSALALSYLRLGVAHILGGFDHLLFVLGLILLAQSLRSLALTITAFTAAHSVTLTLSALGLLKLSPAPIEACIALSIVLLAVELTRPREGGSSAARRPARFAFAFGLLHGFGFAGALLEIGLPKRELPVALLGFNLGVEVGQLLFVGAVLCAFSALRWLGPRVIPASLRGRPSTRTWPAALPAYAIGSLAACFLFERVAAFFP